MSINLRLLVPEETTNYVLNPQLRYDTTGWALNGSTITRTLDYARFGIASLQVVTPGTALNEGAYYRVSSLQGISDNITVSAYVRGSGKVRIRLIDNPTGQEFASQPVSLTPDRWQRLIVTGLIAGTAAGDDVRLYVETADTTAKAITFYIDGAQMERKPYSTSYCDGDQDGCKWNVANSASISTRTADTRTGGRWIDLAGPCRADDDLYVTVIGGMGAAPISNQVQPFALAAGSFHQGYKVNSRSVTISFHAKNADPENPLSIRRLHELKQQLIDIIKPDLTIGGEAFLLEYSDTDADRPLYCRFRYEAGLEGEWDIRNGYYSSFPVRLLAVDPYWVEDNQDVKQVSIQTVTQISAAGGSKRGVFMYKKNKWTEIAQSGVEHQKFLKSAPDGTMYFFSFGTISGQPEIFKWDGDTYTSIGVLTGPTSGSIMDIEIAPDGTIYLTGDFTAVDGVAASYIAKRSPTTGLWSALGTGLNGIGYTLLYANNGNLYVGGAFTTAGGITCSNIARWDGFQWRTVGATSGVDGTGAVEKIVKGLDSKTLYIGGQFVKDRLNTITYNNVASINIDTNLLSACGYGVNNSIIDMAVGKDGTLYVCGTFTASGSPGTGQLLKVAMWKGGNTWSQIGDGITTTGSIYSIAIDKNDQIYLGLATAASGSVQLRGSAKYVQGSWINQEIYSNTNSNMLFRVDVYGDIVLSIYSTNGQVTSPYYNSVINQGTSKVFPIMYIKGQGTVRFIGNSKTGQGVYLDLSIFANEEVFIDFAKGEIESASRGSLIYTILPGSEIRSIELLPKTNDIGVLIDNDVSCIAQLRYQPRHLSADAIVNAENL